MECLGPECANLLIQWLQARASAPNTSAPSQGRLFSSTPYQDDAPAIRSRSELEGAIEHLEFAIFRRYENQLTRAERARLDNTIDNALFKVDRYVQRLDEAEREAVHARCLALRESVVTGRERADRLRHQAKRADLKLAQLSTLTPEGFEEFVAEVFEAMGYEVDRVGGTGDEGADLKVRKAGLLGIVQCKYHSRGVVGSPELQKFLGTGPPHAEPQGFLRDHPDLLAGGREVRGRSPDRADRRSPARRARPGRDGAGGEARGRAGLVLSPSRKNPDGRANGEGSTCVVRGKSLRSKPPMHPPTSPIPPHVLSNLNRNAGRTKCTDRQGRDLGSSGYVP